MQPPTTSSRPHRLGIVDDDSAVLTSLSRMLTACGYDVTTYDSADAYLSAAKQDPPDALLLDLCMPGTDGLSLVDQLRESGSLVPTVFLSGHASVPTSVRAIRAGAVDFLEKPCDEATLLAALARAFDIAGKNQSRTGDSALRARWRTLTPRERQVVRQVSEGRLNKQIAATLGTTEKTVKVHRGRGMTKMGVSSVAELVRLVDRLNLPDQPTAHDAAPHEPIAVDVPA